MERHINIVAAIQIGFSIFGVVIAALIYFVLNIAGNLSGDQEANFILNIIANSLTVFFIVLSLPGILGGIGLLKRKEWARILVLIVSVLQLFNFPLGTAVGAYSIWALVQPEVVAEFNNAKTN
jgi:phage shock protein PspC (stress-responsive transcriptional regulator)